MVAFTSSMNAFASSGAVPARPAPPSWPPWRHAIVTVSAAAAASAAPRRSRLSRIPALAVPAPEPFAVPVLILRARAHRCLVPRVGLHELALALEIPALIAHARSEEHTSELQSRLHLVC